MTVGSLAAISTVFFAVALQRDIILPAHLPVDDFGWTPLHYSRSSPQNDVPVSMQPLFSTSERLARPRLSGGVPNILRPVGSFTFFSFSLSFLHNSFICPRIPAGCSDVPLVLLGEHPFIPMEF